LKIVVPTAIYPVNISQSSNIVKRRDGSWFLDAGYCILDTGKIRLKAKV
jgi:hypothetical protein